MSMIGKSLAHYQITSQIGEGGMGEVYQATDTKLGRSVAIKVLPEEFAKDADRVARFQREAKLLASLNHPNIAAIHGLEEDNGIHFLVLELVEGQTLAERIISSSIEVEEALKLGLQIAEALEAAHEKGVIHRDLKPANIKVTPEGKVKVLDFGLAKAYAGEQDQMNLSNSPTLSDMATQQGLILGTAAYMSPEQARGKPVDKRTDVWAFGGVLYEMLTGKAAFQGEDVTEILAAVVKSGVNMDLLPANLHPRVREVLSRCLQKDQKKRYRDIGEAQYEIERVLADPGGVLVTPVTVVKAKKIIRLRLPWVIATTILGIIIGGLSIWFLKPTEPPEVIRFDYVLPEDQEFTGGTYGRRIAISSDGTKIVYAANQQLYLKKLNELTASPIRGTEEDPNSPFFSPDGQWIGYYSGRDNQFKKISINGVSSVQLCDAKDLSTPTWVTDDMIIFGGLGGITRFSPNEGVAEKIIKGEESEWYYWPQILPGGKSVLYSLETEKGFQFVVQSLESEERKVLYPGGPARYLPTGHIVYGSENTLTAIRFNPDTFEIIGSPIPLIEDVFRLFPDRSTQLVISNSGTLVYMPGKTSATIQGTLVWVDREGNEQPIEEEARSYDDPKISPDGTRVALAISAVDGNEDIWIYDLVRKIISKRLTRDESRDFFPIWTPDSKRIIFGSDREGATSIFWKSADGSGEVEQVTSMEDAWIWPQSLSNNENILFFGEWHSGGDNIGMVPMEGDRTPKLLLQEEYNEIMPQNSPDGQWLAYVSDESGQNEVYIRRFPNIDSGGLEKVSTNGGIIPLWSPDGRELYYENLDDEQMVVSVETDPILKPGKPQRLFDNSSYTSWDIDPKGKRFLMIKEVEATEDDSAQGRPRKIIVVTNWFEELNEKAPVD